MCTFAVYTVYFVHYYDSSVGALDSCAYYMRPPVATLSRASVCLNTVSRKLFLVYAPVVTSCFILRGLLKPS